jgi:hypothetical protein
VQVAVADCRDRRRDQGAAVDLTQDDRTTDTATTDDVEWSSVSNPRRARR